MEPCEHERCRQHILRICMAAHYRSRIVEWLDWRPGDPPFDKSEDKYFNMMLNFIRGVKHFAGL
jgi:hypothetical protein